MSRRAHYFLYGWILMLAFASLAACARDAAPQPATVEVTREVEIIVTVEVTRLVTVDGEVVPTATPAPPPTPTPRPTPAEVGQPGDFTPEDLDMLFEIWELIEDNYDGNLPTDEFLRDTIIAAAVETLGDRFTIYYPAEAAERIRDGFRGDFEGIGAFVGTNDNGEFYIARPIPNTPAAAAGLLPQDIVLAVDGVSIAGWTTDEVVAVVRGPAGQPVTLTIRREGTPEPFDVTIVRARILVPVVESNLYEGNVGYVQLLSFNQLATEQLEQSIEQLLADGATSLIFDLRYNGGGLLTQAVAVGDLFLPEGVVVVERDRNGNEEIFETGNGDLAEEIPLVVLVNEDSASASELVAAAIQERERGTIVGTNTFGKGSVQTPITLEDGSEIRITIARFYSPGNQVIDGVGVTPDIYVEGAPLELGGEDDVQLQRAIEFLQTGQ